MPLSAVVLNPGAGGASVLVDQNSSTGIDTPVTEAIVDGALVSGSGNISLPVTEKEMARQLYQITQKLDAILLCLLDLTSGRAVAPNHPGLLPPT